MEVGSDSAGRARRDVLFLRPGLAAGYVLRILVLLLLVSAITAADDVKLSSAQRMAILRTFLAERPFLHRGLPRGKAGVHIEGDKITPADAELNQLIAQYGPVAKTGDRVQITAVRFEHQGILFEINGGADKRKGWRDRVSVGAIGVNPADPQDQPPGNSIYTNASGSSVFLAIKADAAALTTDRIKDMLLPVLDFNTKSVAEAYQKNLPPLLGQAVKEHHALVGMDKEMVTYTMGRPPHRVRENRDGKDYEEWIYGEPPRDVEFIRFFEDKVVSIEEMKVNGEKVVRTEDEVGALGGAMNASAKNQPAAMAAPNSASPTEQTSAPPTLLRPGEKPASTDDAPRGASPKLPPEPAPPPNAPNFNAPDLIGQTREMR
jgi:hypothetical protein